MQIAIIVMRYGLDIVGGAEYHARVIAEHLQKYYDVEVLTTCAKDYRTWKNEKPEGTEIVNSIKVRRFKNSKVSNPDRQKFFADKIFLNPHDKNAELLWIEEQGPFCPDLIQFLEFSKNDFDCFIFFTFRYFTSYHGIIVTADKAFLAPLAEDDPALTLSTTEEIFRKVKGIIYNSPEERKLIRQRVLFKEHEKIFDVVGCGIEIQKNDEHLKDISSNNNFILYLGRIEGSKGCYQLFEYYFKLLTDIPDAPSLILAGFDSIGVPKHPKIQYVGFISEARKIWLLSNAKCLVMPSPYESLSLVTLEAMASGTPVLVNGDCEVLKGHCIRSNAGLWYQNYEEFKECLFLLLTNPKLVQIMRKNGVNYIKNNYTWDLILQKYLGLIGQIKEKA